MYSSLGKHINIKEKIFKSSNFQIKSHKNTSLGVLKTFIQEKFIEYLVCAGYHSKLQEYCCLYKIGLRDGGSQYNIPSCKIRREPRDDYVTYQNKCHFAGKLSNFFPTGTNPHFAAVLMKFTF